MTNILDDNGWEEYRKLILSDLNTLKDNVKNHVTECSRSDKEFRKEFHNFRVEVISEIKTLNAKLSIKASIAGALSGILGALSIILIYLATQ